MARAVLKSAGVRNWLKTPIVKGRQRAINWLNGLPENLNKTPECQALIKSIKDRGRFSVVVGFTTNMFRWADVGSGKVNEKLDGEIIAKHFENIQ